MPAASDTSQSQIAQNAKRLRGRFAGRARHVSVQDMANAVMAEAAARRAPPPERKPRST